MDLQKQGSLVKSFFVLLITVVAGTSSIPVVKAGSLDAGVMSRSFKVKIATPSTANEKPSLERYLALSEKKERAEPLPSPFDGYHRESGTCPESNFLPVALTSNRQRKSLGNAIHGAGLIGFNVNDIPGQDYQIQIGFNNPEFKLGSFVYNRAFRRSKCNTLDRVFSIEVAAAKTEIELDTASSISKSASIRVLGKKALSNSDKSGFFLGIDLFDLEQSLMVLKFREKQTQVVAGWNRKWQISAGVNYLEFGFRKGTGGFGASGNDVTALMQPEGNANFAEYSFNFQYHGRVPGIDMKHTFKFRLMASGSNDALPADQGFSFGKDVLGGMGTAYDPAELVGDWGVGVEVEIGKPIQIGGSTLKPYLIWDVARIGKNRPTEPSLKVQSAASGGVGIVWRYRQASVGIEYAKPLTKNLEEEGGEARLVGVLCVGACPDRMEEIW